MDPTADRIAFLYPGQGTLPREIVPAPDDLERLYAIAEDAGLPLRRWTRDADVDRLSRTDAAQPALFLDSLVRTAALHSSGLAPDVVAGHSLGEYSALVAAGVLAPHDALRLILRRGSLMRDVLGGMVAVVKLDLETVRSLCREIGPDLHVANHNGPAQVVVSGPAAALDAVVKAAASRGGRGLRLAVSGPFHSPLMRPAETALAPEIERASFSAPCVPIVSSVSGAEEGDPSRLKALLTTQMTSCVLWADVLEALEARGVTHAVEVGAGDVLTNLGRRASKGVRFLTYQEAVDGAL
ncbi:MAG: ACP S-malonyltransferase [Candidatus Bipolaricaulis sp.]|nr:ACP S-malonyltransferase [Candidatus Bipolaricaulis sp.]MDD5219652.1 ACP S-malonyltransferase [Candidatus Bipolaricaulis sp.]MDD5646840.1 ACP S-malonyltransferase [Candidatus Bipolaricaulis sp.]